MCVCVCVCVCVCIPSLKYTSTPLDKHVTNQIFDPLMDKLHPIHDLDNDNDNSNDNDDNSDNNDNNDNNNKDNDNDNDNDNDDNDNDNDNDDNHVVHNELTEFLYENTLAKIKSSGR